MLVQVECVCQQSQRSVISISLLFSHKEVGYFKENICQASASLMGLSLEMLVTGLSGHLCFYPVEFWWRNCGIFPQSNHGVYQFCGKKYPCHGCFSLFLLLRQFSWFFVCEKLPQSIKFSAILSPVCVICTVPKMLILLDKMLVIFLSRILSHYWFLIWM